MTHRFTQSDVEGLMRFVHAWETLSTAQKQELYEFMEAIGDGCLWLDDERRLDQDTLDSEEDRKELMECLGGINPCSLSETLSYLGDWHDSLQNLSNWVDNNIRLFEGE